MEKLIKIQGELKAPKNQYNSFGGFKYRTAEDILEAVKPLLVKNGCLLTLSDSIEQTGERIYVCATATITDKENTVSVKAYAREEENKKGMDAAQISGAASSYARKYAMNGLFLIDDNKDPDYNKESEPEQKEEEKQEKGKPVLTKETVTPKGKNVFEGAVEHLKQGGAMIDIEARYHLTKEIKIELLKHLK